MFTNKRVFSDMTHQKNKNKRLERLRLSLSLAEAKTLTIQISLQKFSTLVYTKIPNLPNPFVFSLLLSNSRSLYCLFSKLFRFVCIIISYLFSKSTINKKFISFCPFLFSIMILMETKP